MKYLSALALASLTGCLDFEQAKAKCLESGGCISQFEAPTLVSSTPENQAIKVSVNTSLGGSFSKPMNRASVGRPTISPPVVLSDVQWSDDDRAFVVQPLAALAFGTTYTVALSGLSQEGAALAAGSSFSFRTVEVPDTTAPTLLASSPVSGLMGVAPTARLTLTFSEPMARDSLDVSTTPVVGLGNPEWDVEGRTVFFSSPLDDWQPETTYIVQFSATDLAQNALAGSRSINFKTGAVVVVDMTPPTVIATTPSPDAGNIDVRANVGVTFSEPVQVTGATFTVAPVAGCAPQLDPTNTRLTCNNLGSLSASQDYTVSVPVTVKDLAGNPLASAFVFSFQTGAVADTTRPTIVSPNPVDAAVGAALRNSMQVTFSEPMDQATTQQAFAISNPVGTLVDFSWSADGKTLTATPRTDFTYGQVVRWQMGVAASDLAGNTLLSTQQFTFTVRRTFTTSLTPVEFGTTAKSVKLDLLVGDDLANNALQAYLVYALPSNALEVTGATLTLSQTLPTGGPFLGGTSALGIYAEGVRYTAPLDDGEDAAPAFCWSGLKCSVSISKCDQSVLVSTGSTAIGELKTLNSVSMARMASVALGQPGKTFAIRLRRGFVATRVRTDACANYQTDRDGIADFIGYFSPNDATVARRPVYTIQYTAP
jgi:hypothetical protein